ncbi:MAG: GNAT family N-acetyltransferase [Chitinophagaceae bacterium]
MFETKRVWVCHYSKNDGAHFFSLNGDKEIMQYIRPAKTREETDLFLSEIFQKQEDNPGEGRWAVWEKNSGGFIGSFAFIPIEGTDKMQIGYALLKSEWGKGYATELTYGGLQYVFTKTDLSEIFAVTEVPNIASQKVLLKAGFIMNRAYEEGDKKLYQYIFPKQNYQSQNLAITPV